MIGPGGGGARLAAGSPEVGEGKMKGRILFWSIAFGAQRMVCV